jgi:hypothetical protein
MAHLRDCDQKAYSKAVSDPIVTDPKSDDHGYHLRGLAVRGIRNVNAFGPGVLTVSWHTYSLCSSFWKKSPLLYEMILHYCSDAWMTRSENVVWWHNNGC